MHHDPKPGLRPGLSLIAAACAALLLATPVGAQGAQDTPAATPKPAARKAPAKSAPAAPVKNRANLMTRDELRACMDEQDRLQAIRTSIEQEEAELDRHKARIQAMDAERQQRAAALDPADAAGRQAIEAELVQRDQEADAYNTRLAGLREKASGYGTGRQAWVERCTTKNFDEMDEAAVRKERAQAARLRK